MVKAGSYSAREAAEELGVSLATLYAYVSRGLIRSESEGGTRNRRPRGIPREWAVVHRRMARQGVRAVKHRGDRLPARLGRGAAARVRFLAHCH